MAINYIATKASENYVIICLSSDTKPTAVSNATLIETDTGIIYKNVASVWTAIASSNSSGTNTGDNATNSQYSGLEASKQDTLVSATNIKTINGSTVLGSGNLVVSGATEIKQTEIDFGSVPLKMKKITVTDAAVIASNKINVIMSYDDPTDGDTDSAEWFENVVLMAKAGSGEFYIYANSPYQDLTGKLKVNYIVG